MPGGGYLISPLSASRTIAFAFFEVVFRFLVRCSFFIYLNQTQTLQILQSFMLFCLNFVFNPLSLLVMQKKKKKKKVFNDLVFFETKGLLLFYVFWRNGIIRFIFWFSAHFQCFIFLVSVWGDLIWEL